MGDLVRRTSLGASIERRAAAPFSDGGRAIEHATWDVPAIAFDEFAQVSHPFGDHPVVDAVSDDGLVRRRRSDRAECYFRRRVGFRAWPSGIVVVAREQPLAPLPDGRMAVRGPYGTPSTSCYSAIEPVVRRIGDVPIDPPTVSEAAPPERITDRQHERAFGQLAFLPAPVRRSVLQRAPKPTHFIAEAVRLDMNSSAPVHRVSVLRMDERCAVVVVGSRQHHAGYWQVEQRTYVLGPGLAIAAASPPHGL